MLVLQMGTSLFSNSMDTRSVLPFATEYDVYIRSSKTTTYTATRLAEVILFTRKAQLNSLAAILFRVHNSFFWDLSKSIPIIT